MKLRIIPAMAAALALCVLTACSGCGGGDTDVTEGAWEYGEAESKTGLSAKGPDTSNAIDLFAGYGETTATETTAAEETTTAEKTTMAQQKQETTTAQQKQETTQKEQQPTYMVEEPDVTTWTGPVEE